MCPHITFDPFGPTCSSVWRVKVCPARSRTKTCRMASSPRPGCFGSAPRSHGFDRVGWAEKKRGGEDAEVGFIGTLHQTNSQKCWKWQFGRWLGTFGMFFLVDGLLLLVFGDANHGDLMGWLQSKGFILLLISHVISRQTCQERSTNFQLVSNYMKIIIYPPWN